MRSGTTFRLLGSGERSGVDPGDETRRQTVASSAASTRFMSLVRGCSTSWTRVPIRPLTAVVAPPGAGKSVVLAAWVRERCPAAAWVACEELDSDPVVFWGHVGAALRAAQGDRWLDVVELLGEPDPDLVVVVDTVLRGLEDEPAVLVLDDVHVARDAGPLVSRFVERLPAGSRVVTGSRGDPPFALHRLRADGRCLEVREAELRLTPDEVDGLVNALGVNLSPDASRVLADRTDGWVAGVQMAAIALRSEPDPDRFLAEFSGSVRIVSDFLVEEVLARQSEVVQRFLLRTSVLDELEPGACAAVTGHDDAADFLRRLETSALFVVPTGNETYRYHQLFRDMLRYQLRATSLDGALDAHRARGRVVREPGQVSPLRFRTSSRRGRSIAPTRSCRKYSVPFSCEGARSPCVRWSPRCRAVTRRSTPAAW